MDFNLRAELIGYSRPGKDGAIEAVSARAFKSACYAAANVVGGRVSEFREPGVTPNFHVAHIAEGQVTTAVLGHRVEPYVAFAPPIDTIAMSTEFIDHDGLAAAFRDYSAFTPLNSDTLNRPLSKEQLTGLRKTVINELSYWRADTLGKAMFNWFD